MSNVYISCPVSVPLNTLSQVEKLATESGVLHPMYWTRGNPYHWGSFIETCDAFILMTPKNNWSISIDDLPSGCKREVRKAMDNGRRLFLAYKASDGLHIYNVIVSNNVLSGVKGSSNKFAELFGKKPDFGFGSPYTGLGNSASLKNEQLSFGSAGTAGFGTTYIPKNPFSCPDHIDALMAANLVFWDKDKTYEDLAKSLWKSYSSVDKRAALLL